MSEHLYLGHLKCIVSMLEKLNEMERSIPDEPTSMYMAGPISLMLDGEAIACRFRNDIGDEWCLEVWP